MMTGRAGAVLVLRRAANNPAAITCTPGPSEQPRCQAGGIPAPRGAASWRLGGPGPGGDTGRAPTAAVPTAETSGTSQSCSWGMRAAGGDAGPQWKVPTVPTVPVVFAVPVPSAGAQAGFGAPPFREQTLCLHYKRALWGVQPLGCKSSS